jgi:hypothetical protein
MSRIRIIPVSDLDSLGCVATDKGGMIAGFSFLPLTIWFNTLLGYLQR